jgi:hypothetical protein
VMPNMGAQVPGSSRQLSGSPYQREMHIPNTPNTVILLCFPILWIVFRLLREDDEEAETGGSRVPFKISKLYITDLSKEGYHSTY